MSTSPPPQEPLGRRRSPAMARGYLAGRAPRTKGRRYPPDPPRTEEIIAVMRCCGDGMHGDWARALKRDAHAVLRHLCHWLGIDEQVVATMDLAPRNRTQHPRSMRRRRT